MWRQRVTIFLLSPPLHGENCFMSGKPMVMAMMMMIIIISSRSSTIIILSNNNIIIFVLSL